MISVSFTPDELYAGCAVGCHRRISSIFKRTKDEHYTSEDNSEWSTEIESALAEMAFAKYKNRYWSGMQWDGKVATADVGRAQVRHTHHQGGHLIIYEEDADEAPYVLVVGRAPIFIIVGWIVGRNGKDRELFNPNAKFPAFFVPQQRLNKFE